MLLGRSSRNSPPRYLKNDFRQRPAANRYQLTGLSNEIALNIKVQVFTRPRLSQTPIRLATGLVADGVLPGSKGIVVRILVSEKVKDQEIASDEDQSLIDQASIKSPDMIRGFWFVHGVVRQADWPCCSSSRIESDNCDRLGTAARRSRQFVS